MKLIQCHIENFGKLHHFDYSFTAGLNYLKATNGWGKSTFATFIKAMFYGLPATTKKNLDENERKKYQPWQGGNYGGNLVFSVNGKQYKIERFFGAKQTEDTFSLVDLATGKKSRDYSENLGVELLGLDEAAFERSSYLPQKLLDAGLNESITQKLNQMIQGTTENYNCESALARLDKKRVSLSNNKKTGQLQNLATKLDEVEVRIHELAGREAAIDELQKRITEQNAEIQTLQLRQQQVQQQIKDYARLQEKHAHQEMFAELCHKVDATRNAIKSRQAILRGHQTDVAEIDRYIALEKTITAQEKALQINGDNGYAKTRKQALETYFGGKIPNTEAVQAVYNDVLQYNALQAKSNVGLQRNGQKSKQTKWWRWGLLLLSVLCILSGFAALKVQLSVAVALFVVGGVSLVVALYLSLVDMINVKTTVPQNLNDNSWQKDQTTVLNLQQRISAFVGQYENTHDYWNAINKIQSACREYENLQAQLTWQKQQAGNLSSTVAEDKTRLNKFLAQFACTALAHDTAEQLALLKQTVVELANLQTQLTTELAAVEQYKVAKNFDINEAAVTVDINELQRIENELQSQIDKCQADKVQLRARIEQIQNEMTELDELMIEHENLLSEQKILAQELKAVQTATKFLQIANDSLVAKFLEPMKSGLKKYLQMITTQNFENLHLDTDFKIEFEEYGQLRTTDYYSRGYQNAIDLSLRFALIDALYNQEKPFIILDDPFINLDEDKVAQAKAFLQTLSKDYQLIYFSCHGSRC